MNRQPLYKQRPWYTRELPSRRQVGDVCRVWSARAGRWLREPLRPWELLHDAESRLRGMSRKQALRAAEVCLWIVAVASLGFCSIAYGSAAVHQAREKAILAAMRANPGAHGVGGAGVRASQLKAANEVLLGLIEIPRLDTAAIVEEGVSTGRFGKRWGMCRGRRFLDSLATRFWPDIATPIFRDWAI